MGHYNNARGLSLFKAHFQRIHKANKWHPLYLKFCLRSFWGSSLWMSFNPIFQNIFIKFRIMFLKVRTTKKLVGGCNPSEKYARQNGFIFPNFRGEHKNIFELPPPRKKRWHQHTISSIPLIKVRISQNLTCWVHASVGKSKNNLCLLSSLCLGNQQFHICKKSWVKQSHSANQNA